MRDDQADRLNLDSKTVAAANGIADARDAFRAVAPPIYLTSTFAFPSLNHAGPYEYTRTANPGRDMLADTLGMLGISTIAAQQ